MYRTPQLCSQNPMPQCDFSCPFPSPPENSFRATHVAPQSNATPYNASTEQASNTFCVAAWCAVHQDETTRAESALSSPPPLQACLLPSALQFLFSTLQEVHPCHSAALIVRRGHRLQEQVPDSRQPSKPCGSGWPCRWWRESRSPCQWPKWPGHR